MKQQGNNATFIARFLGMESAGGILLMAAAVLAIIVANSPLYGLYQAFLDTPVQVRIGALDIHKPALLWINDGLMAVFFLMVGLELKREFLEGELSRPGNIALPAIGAIGGMAVPALIYWAFNHADPVAVKGWAIPAATDIAFALGILALLGSRVPTSLKVFLTSLAIFDDVGAIVIIALFYTSKLSLGALGIAGLCTLILFAMNRRGILERTPYILVGTVMWIAMLKSGIHATLAGVLLALFIPNRPTSEGSSPLKDLEQDLHAGVAFVILPIFAFANAGLDLRGMGLDQVLHGVPMGIALGLFLGKQLGIFAFCWLGIRLGMAGKPADISWTALYATAALCGVGFTMSLFIGSLAFEETGVNLLFDERLGIIIGSLLSGITGYLLLKKTLQEKAPGSP